VQSPEFKPLSYKKKKKKERKKERKKKNLKKTVEIAKPPRFMD
jgi:hypothetical protein